MANCRIKNILGEQSLANGQISVERIPFQACSKLLFTGTADNMSKSIVHNFACIMSIQGIETLGRLEANPQKSFKNYHSKIEIGILKHLASRHAVPYSYIAAIKRV